MIESDLSTFGSTPLTNGGADLANHAPSAVATNIINSSLRIKRTILVLPVKLLRINLRCLYPKPIKTAVKTIFAITIYAYLELQAEIKLSRVQAFVAPLAVTISAAHKATLLNLGSAINLTSSAIKNSEIKPPTQIDIPKT
ncbi:unannotated protein [freshwater metagenome]|uniref:Unannotated protein n=1 Tax=freshwater metagenome TaxID=449393 RepID=A0A6J6FU69_9ZZZZ